MANNGRIIIDVDINGHVKGFEQAIQQASNKLATMPLVKDNPLAKAIEKAKREMADLNKLAAEGISSKGDQSKLENQYERVKRSIEDMASAHQKMANMSSKDFKKLIDKDVIVGYDEAKKAVDEYAKSLEQLTTEKRRLAGKQGAQTRRTNQMANLEGSTDKADIAKLDTLREKFNAAKDEINTMSNSINTKAIQALEKLKQSLESMGLDTSNITDVKTALESVADQLINTDKIVEDTQQSFKDNDATIEQFRTILKDLGYDITEVGNEFDTASDKMDLDNTISRNIKNFFSLTNAIYLFRRAIMSSFNTVKELDAVMTETAVVTDFSVSDMWDKLPEYTKMANELGATTKGAYETATLYYQQGLKTNEVMAVSAETMKMARIAGLDYATATDYMTAALRGFNMEITTDSAERVNDVYSRLAAVTASNTQEISVAMTKVASLAHNANMEFETTAAFLAQIIETTRESAETAGTALKTVVARFTEVKKLYNEGELLGTDEGGEEIDVNKVATALRSAGIDMNKYFTGQVGLDDIFMGLASKWDNLDKVQQRYIATMAAGSRQQSRFIAMMSNYQRTLELVGEAENSAGAGQKQFEKTMESLEAKLNKLKNAWDSFLMGLANSDLIKSVVDWITELITKLNEFINGISNGNGIFKTFVTLMTTLAGMKLGKSLLTGTAGILSGLMENKGANQNGKKVSWLGRIGTALSKRTTGQVVSRSELGDIWETRQVTIADDVLRIFNKFKGLNFKEGFDAAIKGIGKSFEGWLAPLKSIGTYLAPAGPYIAGLLAILAIIKLIKFATEQEKKAAENLRNEAANIKEEIDNVKESISQLHSKEEDIKSLTKSTLEWRLAVQELNKEYEKLLKQSPEYQQFILKDKYGNYYIDEETEAAWEQKKEAQAEYKLNRADQVEVEQAQKAYEKALGKALNKTNVAIQSANGDLLTREQYKAIVDAIDSGKIYNEESWRKFQEENGIETNLAFEQIKGSVEETTDALHNFMEALNIYAQKMGFGSITEDEYNTAKEGTKEKVSTATSGMSNKELYDYAKSLGVTDFTALQTYVNTHGGATDINGDNLGWDNSANDVITQDNEEVRKLLIDAITNGSELDLSYLLNNLSGQGGGWYLGSDTSNHFEASDTSEERQKSFEEMSKESVILGVDISDQTAAWENLEGIREEILELSGQDTEESEKLLESKKKELAIEEKKILAEIENLDNIKKAQIAMKKTSNILKNSLKDVSSPDELTEDIAKSINEAFNLDPGTLSLDFLKNNFENLLGIINGDTEALHNFQNALQQEYNMAVAFTADGRPYIEVVDALDETTQQLLLDMIAAGAYVIEEIPLKAGAAYLKPIFDKNGLLTGFENAVAENDTTYQVVRPAAAPDIPSPSGAAPSSSGGGGGGGSNSNPDRWLNPYDKFYNLTEQINEALRQREKLERQYDRILKNRWSLQKDIQGNTQARLASLKQEIEMNKRLLAGRQEQLDAVLNEKFLDEDKNIRTFRDFGIAKYANYNTARGTVEIDWEGLERLSGTTDTQLGSVIEDFVKRLEGLQDQWEDTDKVIEDLEDEVQEILDINKEEYLSFEQRVFDAIIDREQKLIDGYSDLSETISNDNEEVLNALSESIDLSRQIRDNTKTEEEIAEKEARLAYLRRDTSGANDLAIKQLEKELGQARESYGDTLIDQEFDRLSQANEDAVKQRERQIEIMQAQLDWQQKVGFFWNEVINLLQNNYGQTDEGIAKELVDLLEATDAFSGMSEFQKADWLQKLHTEWLESESGHASWRLSEAKAASMGESGKESNYSISADQTTAGKALRYDYDRDMWLDEDEGWYTGVSHNAESNLFDYTGYSSKASRDAEAAAQAAKAQAEVTKRSSVGVGSYINASGAPIYTSGYGGSPLTQYFGNDPKYLVLDDYGSSWMVRWHGLSSGITGFFRKGDVRGYKTGGLVNTTGPAWLDGTPQRPEFVLNADQTQAFMKLVDKLGNGTGAGDNYFDVNIVVDQISSDYDVDRLVDRIKQKITEDAQYRNVNAINWIR